MLGQQLCYSYSDVMTVDMENYEEFLRKFGEISRDHITREALEKLKEKYRKDIDSKRALNRISDINCLLQVLKKRGVLRYNDVKALREITDECVNNESIKQQIRDLIENYSQWLEGNSGSINFLYNSGKSNVLLTSHELNVPKNSLKVSETLYLHNNFDEILQTSTEEMIKESLLANEPLNNLNIVENEDTRNRNSFYVIKFPLNIDKKKGTTILIFLILISILIGIICILLKLPGESAAIVPVHSSVQSVSGRNMPFNMSNTNAAGYSTQSTFSVNHTQFYTSTVPPVDRQRELQKLVVNALSKRIGADWKDVCRALDIRENTIDEIAVQHSQAPVGNKNELMFKRGMQLYFSEPQPRWRSDLKKALRMSRRVDLEERVEEILENDSNM